MKDPQPENAARRAAAGADSPAHPQRTEASAQTPPEAVVGPFTLREIVALGALILLFIGTLLPFIGGTIENGNLWNTAPLFFLGIGVLLPGAVGALLVARRVGSAPLRVGSLSVDQFASVAAVLAAVFFFLETVTAFQAGPFVALIGALGLLAATTFGPHLPRFSADFSDRPEQAAHTVARDPAPTTLRESKAVPAEAVRGRNGPGLIGRIQRAFRKSTPDGAVAPGQPASAQRGSAVAGDPARTAVAPVPAVAGDASDGSVSEGPAHDSGDPVARGESPAVEPELVQEPEATQAHTVLSPVAELADSAPREPISATREAEQQPIVEAFWFAVGTARAVVDERTGRKVFTLKPGDWEVGIEDRGHEFLVQDKRTGAVGVLRDLSNIERAPQG